MNELNPTDSNTQEKSQSSKPTPPSLNIIKEFKQLFSKAETSFTQTETTDKLDKQSSDEKQKNLSKNQTDSIINKKTITLKKDDPQISQLFQEMGINQIKQIEVIIIQVAHQIEESTKTPKNTHTVTIQWDNKNTTLKIQPIKLENGSFKINLTCDKGLFALLSLHMPDLKKHLKKKNIMLDEIDLIENSNEKKPISIKKEKNNT